MKIAWFTPFMKCSAIGRYSKLATKILSKYAEVDLFVVPQTSMHETDLKVIYYAVDQDISNYMGNYDFIVYNMGDNYEYHRSIYDNMLKHPGIVIAHDICMHHFFNSFYDQDESGYEKKLMELYSESEARKIVAAHKNVFIWGTMDFLKYNMLGLICENAKGVIVHSNHHMQKLKEVYNGPSTVIPLINMNEYEANSEDERNSFTRYDKNKINVLSVGNVNSNKLVTKMMDAIAGSRFLRKHVNYTVVGNTPNATYLNKIFGKLKKEKLDDNFKILGYVDDKMFGSYYDNADIICNLRYPALEGASASLQEQLLLGKTVIVVDTGVYSEVPDDCVIKISASNMLESLQEQLIRLVKDKDYAKIVGENAHKFALEEYAEEKYIQKFMGFLNEMVFLNPLYDVLFKLKSSFESMGMNTEINEPRLEIINHISKVIEDMFAYTEFKEK